MARPSVDAPAWLGPLQGYDLGGGGRPITGLLPRLRHREAKTDLPTFRRSTSLAAGALDRGLMGAQAAHFFKNAFHLKLGLETLERAIYWLAFSDLDFGHTGMIDGLKNGRQY